MTTPTATQATEWMRRLRSSVRCSIRLMPGSSARSLTAARTLSTRSAMVGGLGRFDLCFLLGVGNLRDGIEYGGERRVAYGKAGRGRHEFEIAGGCDGKRLGDRFRDLFCGRTVFGCSFVAGCGDRVLHHDRSDG